MSLSVSQRLFIFFPTLYCFCLPFGGSVLSAIVVLWLLVSFFNGSQRNILRGLKNPAFQWPVLFFVITCLSAAFSSDTAESFSAIEIKFSFIILPYLFFCFEWPVQLLQRFVVSFVSGCFFACVVLIARAAYFAGNGHPEYFFYSSFSDFIHASYFAMYLILAITFVLVLYPKWFKTQKNILYSSYFFVVVFIITVFLCSSKLGIISLFLCLPVILVYKFGIKVNFRSIAISLLVLGVGLFVLSKVIPTPFDRIRIMLSVSNRQLDKTSSESTTVRWLIWQQSVSIIKNHPIIGVGVGNANNQLYEAYLKNGLTGAYEHKLNAHNQYLQTAVGMGLLGLMGLFALTIWQLVKCILRREFIGTLFFLIIVLNFLVESMLQTAAGVLFFAFFYCFFNLENQKRLETNAV